jgi:hypothetical protein
MTSRERRLHRLFELRTQQHHATTGVLRVARAQLDEVELMLQRSRQQRYEAHENVARVLSHQDHQGWLLANADAEFLKLSRNTHENQRAEATSAVEAAAAQEAYARRERKQMERTCDLVSKEEAALASRAAQQHLEETARLVRGALSNPLHLGRFR